MKWSRSLAAIATFALATASAACAQKTVATSTQSDIAPTMVVESFLRAANSNDLDTMMKLFGSKDGPFEGTRPKKEVDDLMFVLATIVRHEDYKLRGTSIVPGRRDEATNILVELKLRGVEKPITVPFTMVRYKDSWLIEQVPTQQITSAR